MPKINAPTVAEHRAHQREALLRAAVDILVDKGAAAVTPAAVGARAGLARSSVYQYFPSSAALLATIVEQAFPRANSAVAEAMAGAAGPAERIDTFVPAVLRLAAEGARRPMAALMRADLPPECLARLMELHDELTAPLDAAVRDLEPPDPDLTCRLIGSLLQGAMAAVEEGAPVAAVTARTLALIHRGVDPPSG